MSNIQDKILRKLYESKEEELENKDSLKDEDLEEDEELEDEDLEDEELEDDDDDEDVTVDDVTSLDGLVYECPVCAAQYYSPVEILGDIFCPNCDNVVVPELVEDLGEDLFIDEAGMVTRIKGGKKVRQKAKKKGFKRVGNKYVKMSGKEKMARKRAGKKLARKMTPGKRKKAAKKARKSLKKGRRMGLYASAEMEMQFDNDAMDNLLSEMLDKLYSDLSDQYEVPTSVNVTEAVIDGEDLVIQCTVVYENLEDEETEIVIQDFRSTSEEDGDYVSESLESGIITDGEGSVEVEYSIEEGIVTPTSIKFDVDIMTESDEVFNRVGQV